jgi:ribonuclease Z
MNAATIVLTHFSQRYPKFPQLDPASDFSRAALAFDGMALKVSEIPNQSAQFAALEKILDDLAASEDQA